MQRKLLRLTTTVLRCRQMTDSREQISLAQGRQLPAALGQPLPQGLALPPGGLLHLSIVELLSRDHNVPSLY